MDQQMPSRKSASSRLAGLKDYLSQRDFRQTLPSRRALRPGEPGYVDGQTTPQSWSQWAGQKIKRNTDIVNIEELALFPGWATRRYLADPDEHKDAFDIDVQVSGFATTRRSPELATRSQRAFLRLAKGFAALPKLQQPFYPEYDDEYVASLKLPPRPSEISDDYEVQDLEAKFQSIADQSDSEEVSEEDIFRPPSPSTSYFSGTNTPTKGVSSDISSELRRFHANLESRLQPFWASALSSRTIRISVYACPSVPSSSNGRQGRGEREQITLEQGPILTRDVITASDGSFGTSCTIKWKDICTHPLALHIAFDELMREHDLLVVAELIPTSLQASVQAMLHPAESPRTTQLVSITTSSVRVISDIDDTVKVSEVVSGARAVFHNVFVKDFQSIIIPGMAEWYNEMWSKGVRFHYVSNSPFELLPVINQFLSFSQLPPGSIRLRSYAGRSLFNGLLSAPATRKRANVVEVLDSFPKSQFILVGDSGEQDLELYSTLAQERSEQIIGVFIRDVGQGVYGEIEDPTGSRTSVSMPQLRTPISRSTVPLPTGTSSPLRPLPQRTVSEADTETVLNGARKIRLSLSKTTAPPTSFIPIDRPASPISVSYTSSRSSVDSGSSYASTASTGSFGVRTGRRATMQPVLTEAEKKRNDLQARVYRARAIVPLSIPLRVFRNPEECVEAFELLGRVGIGSTA
ncbi:hypothetical protein BJ138DRAFT_1128026 [Hygrophoropsis aurantiaca]|uniref:Uncharacterized protein n=1 Tax=Hygrophoropsis aurantiaca TaxID=72124 RepID=A0ACB8A7B2_9AGAM|nr:hypothetical protein BJ138DRAFT_1128026 [Hygrophoropsis aurantiaca]